MSSKEYELLKEISSQLRGQYLQNQNIWEGSPFEWIKGGITSRQKGAVGEKIVRAFLTANGFSVSDSEGTDSDFAVNGYNMEVKLSTLWEGGDYVFQQIRQQEYDVLFCLGISPDSAHMWVAPKSNIIWDEMRHQHGGERGTDTWWIHCVPAEIPHEWMRPNDGDISKVCGELTNIL